MPKFDAKWVAEEQAKRAFMAENSLYSSEDEHSSCGVGLVVSIDGTKSRKVVEHGIDALKAVWHRGAVDADGKTGDGCGLLLQMPDSFFRAALRKEFSIDLAEQYAVGMVFLSQDPVVANAAREQLNAQLAAQNLTVKTWRVVPTDDSCLGPIAKEHEPRIEQVFVKPTSQTAQEFSVSLFVARRKTELALKADKDFYVCTLSEKVISYKGLTMPVDIATYY